MADTAVIDARRGRGELPEKFPLRTPPGVGQFSKLDFSTTDRGTTRYDQRKHRLLTDLNEMFPTAHSSAVATCPPRRVLKGWK